MRTIPILALALAFSGVGMTVIPEAAAQSARAVRAQAEASMVLTGVIDIGPEGQVESFQMDHREKVNDALVAFVERAVQGWRFEPVIVEGRVVRARAPVSIRLGGKNLNDETMEVTLLAANFDRYDPTATDSVTRVKITPPSYPKSVYSVGGKGLVLLQVQVGRDGRVIDVAAEQVNLKVIANEVEMRRMRDALARTSITAARKWTFRIPTTGKDKDESSWTVRMPVSFELHGEDIRYGMWDAYIPGPRQQAPWRADKALADDAADLLPAGGVYMADAQSGPRLLTPLGG